MFLGDCENFHDYFRAIVEQVRSEEKTKDEALKLLEDKFNFNRNNIRESYLQMYSNGIWQNNIDDYLTLMRTIKSNLDETEIIRAIQK